MLIEMQRTLALPLRRLAIAAAGDLIAAIVAKMKREGGFTPPDFGTYRVAKIKAIKSRNPKTGERVKVKSGKTGGFKASPTF